MTPIPVFKDVGQIQPAWSDMFHDSLRRHMIASIVKPERPTRVSKAGKLPDSLARHASKCAARRAEMMPVVIRMRSRGMTNEAMACEMGVSVTLIKRVLREIRERHTERTAA